MATLGVVAAIGGLLSLPTDAAAPEAGGNGVSIVVTVDKLTPSSDGWIQHDDGTRQWIDPNCRRQLEADGATVTVHPWPVIADMEDRPYQPCSELALDPDSDPSGPTTTTTAPSTTDTTAPTTDTTTPGSSTTDTTAPASSTTTTEAPPAPTSPPGNGPSGPSVLGSGVNFSSGEYWCVSGYDVFEHEVPDDQLAQQMADLGVETVRLPLNEHCWLGDSFGYIKPHLRGDPYRNRVRQFVEVLNNHGMTVVLDLHWNGAPGQEARGQKKMADADYAIPFWASVAETFRSNPNVVFDLYNEPHNISWQCWRDGCTVDGWRTAGMQTLVDTVRNTGANQPIILNGLDWGGDLRGWLDHVPNDPQNNLIAGFHAYNKVTDGTTIWQKRCVTEECWNNELRSIVDAGHGVIIGEAGQDVGQDGCRTDFLERLFTWADQNQIPYLGWSYNPHGCNSPALLTSYDGSLTPAGQVLANHLNR